jgi:NAD(P)-dependent dehydrogenase (short-subunit alcohol dehydrogenase family)
LLQRKAMRDASRGSPFAGAMLPITLCLEATMSILNSKRAMAWTVGALGGALAVSRFLRSLRAIDFAGKSVLIFGGSRGLGLVIARELVAEGARVTLAARDEMELARAQSDLISRGIAPSIIRCDVRNRADVDTAIDRVIAEHAVIDVLINDAGIIEVGPLEHMSLADFEDALNTHFWGPLFSIMAALPHMRRRGARRIVNISSIGGKIAVPHLLPYSASKFALTGLSEGLRAELAREGFAVTTVCPGLMRTGSTYNAKFKGQHRLEFAWFHIADSLPGISISALRAARQILDACRHGDPELIITPAARAAVLLNAVSPTTTARVMAAINRILPAPAQSRGDEARAGWQSISPAAPSRLTILADRASQENNQLPLRSDRTDSGAT